MSIFLFSLSVFSAAKKEALPPLRQSLVYFLAGRANAVMTTLQTRQNRADYSL